MEGERANYLSITFKLTNQIRLRSLRLPIGAKGTLVTHQRHVSRCQTKLSPQPVGSEVETCFPSGKTFSSDKTAAVAASTLIF